MERNIFEKIRDDESPCELVYKDKYVTAFNDIHPDAPAHILIIPNKKIAKELELDKTGYRLITNCGKDGGQEVDYLHFHLVGGVPLGKMISLPKSSKKILKEIESNAEKNI